MYEDTFIHCNLLSLKWYYSVNVLIPNSSSLLSILDVSLELDNLTTTSGHIEISFYETLHETPHMYNTPLQSSQIKRCIYKDQII